jgi:transcriptional regulator with XRE-family HTH domain
VIGLPRGAPAASKLPQAERVVTPIDLHVARRIYGKRRALNLSRDRLAGELNVSITMIEAYERGTERVPAEHLLILAELFSVPLSYFFPVDPCA